MFCTPEADLLERVRVCVCVWYVNKTMTKSQSRLPFLLQLFGPVLHSPMSCHLKCSTQFVLSRRIEAVSQLRNCLCFSLCHALLTHALVPQWQPAQPSTAQLLCSFMCNAAYAQRLATANSALIRQAALLLPCHSLAA